MATLADILTSLQQGVIAVNNLSRVTGSVGPGGKTLAYEYVAASQTAQVLGPTGAVGDYLHGILISPATTSPGAVTLLDGSSSIPLFAGGTSSVYYLGPFFVQLGVPSVNGAWKITTGANVSCIGIGIFT